MLKSRRQRSRTNQMSFDDLWAGATPDPEAKKPFVTRLGSFALASLVVGALSAAPLMPGTVATAATERHFANMWAKMPAELPLDTPLAAHTVLLDSTGRQYADFFSEDRTPVSLDQISPVMQKALLAVEDARFYEHGPIDFQGLARAAARTATGDRQGGSTLTQQLVENILIANADNQDEVAAARAQSLEGKVQELKYAAELEKRLSKDQILESYLNTVYFGSGAYGIEAAAKRYFNTTAANLTLKQSAILAGTMRSPTAYDPIVHPEASEQRGDVVLARMATVGFITEAEKKAAQDEQLVTTPITTPSGCQASQYALYCAYVRDQLLSNPAFGATPDEREENLYRGGLTITTALDPEKMTEAQNAVSAGLNPANRVAAATATVEPGTGYVTAIAQSKPYGQGDNETEIVYADRPAFQPGSSFKMFTLATGLEQGVISTSTTMTAPTGYRSSLNNPASGAFRNSGGESFGAINAYDATKYSVNTWYVKLIEKTGVLPVADMAGRLGITSLPRQGDRAIGERDASLTLGSVEVSPIEMANAYASIAAHGVVCTPSGIVKAVRTQTGRDVTIPAANCHQAISAEVANTVADVFTATFTPGGTASGLQIDRPAAAKTGTTNDNAATWLVGFTPRNATAVWVGDPRGGSRYPLQNVYAYGQRYGQVFGATIAGRIWQQEMRDFEAGQTPLPLNAEVQSQLQLATKSIPDVRGMSTQEAMSALIAAGYTPKLADAPAAPDALYGPDQVVAQSPEAGADLNSRADVVLTLSQGSNTNVEAPLAPQGGNQ